MRGLLRLWLVCIVIVFLFIATATLHYVNKPPQPSWVTVPVIKGDIESSITATGKIDASERVNVGAQVSGQVRRLYTKVGDKVSKGQLIAEIDDLPQRTDLSNAEAALSLAKADLKVRQAALIRQDAQFKRQEQMVKRNFVSREDYDAAAEAWSNAKAELTAQQARIIQAQIEVDKKRLDLGYTKIVSPMDGTIIAIITKQGQTVNALQSAPTIVKIARLDTMIIRTQISEADINNIQPGQKAWFTIFSFPDKRFPATVRSIELAPDSVMKDDAQLNIGESTASNANAAIYYNALLIVPNPDNLLRISMTAQVNLQRDSAKDVLIIPSQAIRKSEDGQQYVEISDRANQPERRNIISGITDSINTEVINGLNAGEKVILMTSLASVDSIGEDK